MKPMRITEQDYIKAVRRADRLREIEMYGKVISSRQPYSGKNRKLYDRKRDKRSYEQF